MTTDAGKRPSRKRHTAAKMRPGDRMNVCVDGRDLVIALRHDGIKLIYPPSVTVQVDRTRKGEGK